MDNPLAILRSYTEARPPINIESAIRAFGLSLCKNADDLDPEISGRLRRLPDGRYEIATNRREHYYRQRFTMAHELGHYILHRDIIGGGLDDDTMYRSTEKGEFYNTAIRQVHEAQANSFAASILMPAQLIIAEIKTRGRDFDYIEVAKSFQVSPSAMRWRLRSLGQHHLVPRETSAV